MHESFKKRWQLIDNFRTEINFIQHLVLEEQDKDMRPNKIFVQLCKSLARWLTGSTKNRLTQANNIKTLNEMLQILAIASSIFEPQADLHTHGRQLLGRVRIRHNNIPDLQLSNQVSLDSSLGTFILAHELIHLFVHLSIPENMRVKSHVLMNGGEDAFEEYFAEGLESLATGEPTFSNFEEVKRYFRNQFDMGNLLQFQSLRELMFERYEKKNVKTYYKECAADLTAAFFPVADFWEIYHRLSPETKERFARVNKTGDILLNALDDATTIYASTSDPVARRKADTMIGGIQRFAFESKWCSPLQILISMLALVNFKSKVRVFDEEAIGANFIKDFNLAFYGAVGIDLTETLHQ